MARLLKTETKWAKPVHAARIAAVLTFGLSQALTAGTAHAQARPSGPAAPSGAPDGPHGKWGLVAGAGAFVTPNYSGDDNYRVLALPFIRVSHGDKFWASVPEGANYKLYEKGPLTLSAKAGIAFPRDEDNGSLFGVSGGGSTELLGLGDLGASIELGGAASYDLGPVSLSAGLRRGVGGHGAWVGDASLSFTKVFKTPGPPIAMILTPNIKFGDADLTQSYYGITAEQSLTAGLPEFRTDGGIYSAGVNALTFIPTSRKSAFIIFGSVRELVGDAADSPLIRERGASTQAAIGLFWVKAFGQDARRAKDLIAGGGF
jgi:outer membrane protein